MYYCDIQLKWGEGKNSHSEVDLPTVRNLLTFDLCIGV